MKLTTADTKIAQSSLLAASDLGKGWTATKSTQRGVSFDCSGYHPNGAGIVETGAAASPNLSYGKTGPFITQETSVYATAKQANTYWQRGVKPGLVTCATQTVEQLRSKGVKVTITKETTLALKTALQHTAGYRVVAKANKLTLYFDVILLGNGRLITSVALSSFQSAPPASVEESLARLVIHKLGGPTA